MKLYLNGKKPEGASGAGEGKRENGGEKKKELNPGS